MKNENPIFFIENGINNALNGNISFEKCDYCEVHLVFPYQSKSITANENKAYTIEPSSVNVCL